MFLYFDDVRMSIELNRILGEITDGGATFGEAYRAGARIDDGDADSWHAEWVAMGEECRERGEEATHPVTTKDEFLRASNYFRQAIAFEDQTSERALGTFQRSKDAFADAVDTGTLDGRPVTVDTDGGPLTGYYFETRRADPDSESATVLVHGGLDSTQEECFFFGAPRVLERGMNCLIFDGYGQGDAIRQRQMFARPDWEVSVSPFVDWLERETDTERIGLLGSSLGGYYGARTAAYEDRLDAVALWSACFDILEDSTIDTLEDHWFQYIVDAVGDPEAAEERLSAFTLADVPTIETPLLVVHGLQDSLLDPEAAEKTAEKATDAEIRYYDDQHNTLHHRVSASTEMYDWLHGQLLSG